MSIGSRRGADVVEFAFGSARLLAGPPLIAPVRSFTFPVSVPGEEDAMARGALWLDVRTLHGSFVAQCALGFATAGVAHGLWAVGERLLAVAGGYAYALNMGFPEQTEFLPLRPVVDVLPLPERATAILTGYHSVCVLDRVGCWQSGRLSWEGITLTGCDGNVLHGLGWDMTTDEEVPFTLDLHTREMRGGGYRVAASPDTA